MTAQIYHRIKISDDQKGKRLDSALSITFEQYSRSLIKKWIENNEITVNGKIPKVRDKVIGGEIIVVNAKITPAFSLEPNPIKLNIVYEDRDIVVLNKPIGLVVHPGAGNKNMTLMNGILYNYPDNYQLPRAGIVHRLDKNTSGLMVVAKNLKSYYQLTADIQDRIVKREYEAIVHGVLDINGKIDAPIGRSTNNRTKMMVTNKGKPATSIYTIIKSYPLFTHLKVKLVTGRTHQIRVHFAHIKHPIIGDQTYGRNSLKMDKLIARQALHACSLSLPHPITKKPICCESELPEDIELLLQELKQEF